MIPIKLTIEGLYSYQKRQTIDFEKLTSSHLFGIFGQVGSGKSSILEAISFAIYGDTERLNKNESRGYNMMNLKSDRLLIEFEFDSGINQKRYLATASARRNSKRFDDVKTIERKAYVSANGDWQPIELGDLEKAIGLSYSNFKRTIIIPQGKFQEFLQLDKKERTNMMKELFGLEKYDLYHKVSAIDKRNSERRQFLEGQSASLGNVDNEVLEQLQANLVQLQETATQLKSQLEAKNKELEQFNRLRGLEEKKNRISEEKTKLEEQRKSIEELEEQLAEYELYQQAFKPLIEQKSHLQNNIQTLKTSIASNKLALQTVQKALEQKQNEQNAIKADYDNRNALQEEAADQLQIATIKEHQFEIQAIEARIAKGEEFVAITENKSKSIAEQIEKKNLELKECKAKIPDTVLLSNAKEWFAVEKGLSNQIQQLSEECKVAEAAKQNIVSKLKEIAQSELLATKNTDGNPEAMLKALNDIAEETAKEITHTDAEIQQLFMQQKLNEFAISLKEGAPCPLCGATHHPNVAANIDVDNSLKTQQVHRQTLEKRQEESRQLVHLIEMKLQEQSIANARFDEIKAKQNKLNEDLALHRKTSGNNKYATEQMLNDALIAVETLNRQAKALDEEIEKLGKDLEESNRNVEMYKNGLNKLKNTKSETAGKIKAAEDSLKRLSATAFADISAEALRQTANEKNARIEKTIRLYDELNSAIADLRQNEGKSAGTLDANQKLLESEELQLSNIQQTLNAKMQEYNDVSEVRINTVLNTQLDIAQTKQRINSYKQNVQTAATQLQEVITELDGKTYDQQQHANAQAEANVLNEQNQNNSKEIGRIDNELTTKRQQKQQYEQIKKDLDAVVERSSILSTLKTLLQGNRFIDYASTTYLRNLCIAANERFYKMTRQRLQLELTDDNSFQVRDFMNGGKTRNVKTLSGGQTFQASLSLALALSDNIQKIQHSSQNFFFLDEGFGTLDKDSLSIVFDTLKTLRNENRIVGVISHVDEMQQEIETYLTVNNFEEQGSIISCSWR